MRFARRTIPPGISGRFKKVVWVAQGRSIPPPHYIKVEAVRRFARDYGLLDLIETGTFHGDMLAEVAGDFAKLTSIEIDAALYGAAVERFRNEPRIEILRGDSAELLASVMESQNRPALLWLDGHCSGGVTGGDDRPNPIEQELRAVLTAGLPHVTLIDDARLFGKGGWPTLADVRAYVKSIRPDVSWNVANDIVSLTPPRLSSRSCARR